ncbi:non-homologous end-joining factor 1 [Alligator mississippiensis]|uniref:Non-homologous end-joining factor 1 n=1 Tax=Alligator mississippiensis TaxID=8496 RepID=A0A151N614_ALLMI|nr:non-homologous end-joining factor 1 [Alligator mississippiensis]
MAVAGDVENGLAAQPWRSLRLPEAPAVLAKACFGAAGYALLLCDLRGAWLERLDAAAVARRSQELNRRLTAGAPSLLARLHELLRALLEGRAGAGTAVSWHRDAEHLTLHVKSELSGLPFYWDFRCAPAPVPVVCQHLARPLLRMSLALQCQLQHLASLLLQKDAEIEDYRESGALLSRDRLQTEPFEEQAVLQRVLAESLAQVCGPEDGQAFADELQPLYIAVVQQGARTRRGSEETPELAAPHDEAAGATDSALPPEPPQGTSEPPQSPARSNGAAAEGSSPSQKPRLLVSKPKAKKAKGLFS